MTEKQADRLLTMLSILIGIIFVGAVWLGVIALR